MKNVRGAWRLLLPSFQRSFVWDEEDVKRFLESILLGYPTGTILLWKPSNPEVDPFALDMIDRVESATLKATTDGSEVYYVVDGQQRLTSLMLLINGWQLYRGGKPIAIHAITVNPSMELPKLYIDPSERRGVDLYRGIRDRFYTDTMESERLRRQLGRDAYDRLMQWIDKILDYNIPMYVIKTRHETPEILERMANIFIMVNRSGQKITNPELLFIIHCGYLRPRAGQSDKVFLRRISTRFRRRSEHNIIPKVRVLDTSSKPQAERDRQCKGFQSKSG
jgi:hypothetical protein